MKDRFDGQKWFGRFLVGDKRIHGELTFAGPKTNLYIQDETFFSTHDIPERCIKGVLRDLTKVSLLQCVAPPIPGSWSSYEGERYEFAEIFPNYILHGDGHLGPHEQKINEVHFVIDDANTLFYDFDAFGSLIDASPFIEQIANANALGRKIKTGPRPEILYFTGKSEILSAQTSLGRVTVRHSPRRTSGGPNGVGLENQIVVTLFFDLPVDFLACIQRVRTLMEYFQLLVGRPQNLLKLDVLTGTKDEPIWLGVYCSVAPVRDESKARARGPHPTDVLVNGVLDEALFPSVLCNWVNREELWRDARERFFNSFGEQNYYDVDRLICAANMFDILPSSAVPEDVPLSDQLQAAKETSRKLFIELPASPERDSVLNALGRVGKSALKQRIRHRAAVISRVLDNRFPELWRVTDEAVNCRNHYIHGTEPRFDYNANTNTVVFFIRTLEFVFAASDLIEAGWDIKAWLARGTTMSHPFGEYRVSYGPDLEELKRLLPQRTP